MLMRVWFIQIRCCDAEAVAATSIVKAMQYAVDRANEEVGDEQPFTLEDIETVQEVGPFLGVAPE